MRKVSMICGLVICMCLAAAAQKTQLPADLGVKLSPSGGSTGGFNFSTSSSNAFAFEVNYARQIKALPMASVQIEFPYVYTATANLKSLNLFAASGFKSMFLTPSLKLQIVPGHKLSPWISAGAGMARYSDSKTTISGSTIPSNTTTKIGYQAGGGVDVKVHKFTFRIEGRELYSGSPNLNVSTIKLHHNILVAGGLVLNF